MGYTYIKNYSLFICNSNSTGNPNMLPGNAILYSFPANMDKNDILLSFFTMQKCMQSLPYPYKRTHIHISDTGPLKITEKCKSVVRL